VDDPYSPPDLTELAPPAGFNSRGQIYMLIVAVLISAFVALFVLRKIWFIWRRGKVV